MFGIDARVSDIRYRHKNFERVLFIWLAYPSFDLTFDFCLSLLAVTVIQENILYQLDEVREDGRSGCSPAETEFLLITPKHGRSCRHTGLRE